MTKEKLKQEAEEWLCNNLHSASEEDFIKAMVDIAEPREKRIAELEKENAELKRKCYKKAVKDYCKLEKENADLKEEINKIAFARGNLEEENAELKHTIATLRQEKDNVSMHAKAMEVVAKTRSDQLTKAKEIIKYLCGMVRELNKPNVQLTNVDYSLSEAEQFLNSEVEK